MMRLIGSKLNISFQQTQFLFVISSSSRKSFPTSVSHRLWFDIPVRVQCILIDRWPILGASFILYMSRRVTMVAYYICYMLAVWNAVDGTSYWRQRNGKRSAEAKRQPSSAYWKEVANEESAISESSHRSAVQLSCTRRIDTDERKGEGTNSQHINVALEDLNGDEWNRWIVSDPRTWLKLDQRAASMRTHAVDLRYYCNHRSSTATGSSWTLYF